jgi:hypothetical protein
LARRCSWSNPVSGARYGIYRSPAEALAPGHHIWGDPKMKQFVKGLISFQRSPWEAVASVLIVLGVLMLMQPFYLVIFTYSFSVILTGTVMYLICSHFKD